MPRANDGKQSRLGQIQHGYVRWATITFIILGAVVLNTVITDVLNYKLFHENSARISDNRHAVAEIQKSRIDATFDACTDTNTRHDNAIEQLDTLISNLPPDQQARAKAGRQNTIILLNAIVPKQDCDKVIKQRFGVTQP